MDKKLALASTLFGMATAGIIFYIFYRYPAYFNSDAATANILADEIIKNGSYFPNGWWYVNGDLWVFFKHTLLIPFAYFGHNGYEAHAIVVICMVVAMFIAVFKLLRALEAPLHIAIFGCFSLALAYSPLYFREIYGEAAYTWYFIFLLLFLFIIARFDRFKKPLKLLSLGFLFFMVFVFTLQSPSRFGLYYVVPLFVSFIVLCSLDEKYHKIDKKYIAAFLATITLGIAARFYLLPNLSVATGANSIDLMPLEQLPRHIWFSFIGLLSFIGGGWRDFTEVTTFTGAMSILKTLFAPVALFAPAIYLAKYYKRLGFFQKYTILVAYIGFGTIFLLYCITTLHFEHLYSAKTNIRYIIPFLLLIIISNATLWQIYSPLMKAILAFSLILGTVNSALLLYKNDNRDDMRLGLIERLKLEGLKIGYAPFWSSHVITAMSGGEIEMRPLKEVNGKALLEPNRWLSHDRWYTNEYIQNGCFVLMPNDKIEQFEKTTSAYQRAIAVDGYKIYIFDKNPLIK